MKKIALVFAFGFAVFAHAQNKVVMIAIDGVRDLEMAGKAKDDDGRTVPAQELFPQLTKLKAKGVFYPEMKISNPAGVSLPAYADVFAGHRQEKISSNHPGLENLYSHYPTIFEAVKKAKDDTNAAALIGSWKYLCPISTGKVPGEDGNFYKSCGWEPKRFLKPEVYEGSRSDMDTFLEVLEELPKRHPLFTFIHLGDADEEAHMHHEVHEKKNLYYGIFNYHKALKEVDYYVGRIWKMLQADPFYKDSTYLIVYTDHGRDNAPDATQWATHGDCIKAQGHLCTGCPRVFALVAGPGLKRQVVKRSTTHLDLSPTAAKLIGVDFPSATGTPLVEVLTK